MKLSSDFFIDENVVDLAQQLLGKVLVTRIDGKITSGIISETEAYNGISDKASHAYGGRKTARTSTMYEKGGISYVYLCYGIHHLFNVVTGPKNNPQAILIRAIQPLEGKEEMMRRRKSKKLSTGGPGTLSQALGIGIQHNAISLRGPLIYIRDENIRVSPSSIAIGPRIGVDYAGEDALLPYRFLLTKDYTH